MGCSPSRIGAAWPGHRAWQGVSTHLYGQEINAETYTIARADLLLTGEGDAAHNVVGGPEYSLLTRSSDGQLMFLVIMPSMMKDDTPLQSRVAEVHNGSSLFTGFAGQSESNIRRSC